MSYIRGTENQSMLKPLLSIFCMMQICIVSNAQILHIRGKVKCLNQDSSSSKGAENVVIVPNFIPSKSTQTQSFPSGYFEFSTGVPVKQLQDKTITLTAISKCKDCKKMTYKIFVPEQAKSKNNEKVYITTKDWKLEAKCKDAELAPRKTDSVLSAISNQAPQDLSKMSNISALAGTPALLNFINTTITAFSATGLANNHYWTHTIFDGDINYGQFLFASSMYHTASKGFNFSPSRDMSESVLWNPSSIALSAKKSNVSLLTNTRNNIKASAYTALSEKLSVGIGFIGTRQDEFRKIFFKNDNTDRLEDSLIFKLQEANLQLAAAYQISSSMSFGITAKGIYQQFNNPDSLFCDNQGIAKLINKDLSYFSPDADISFSYKPTVNLQFGGNLMNVLGSKLYRDLYTTSDSIDLKVTQRCLGLGTTYKWNRFHAGLDVLMNESGLFDANLGINLVPFNNGLISVGLSFRQMSYSLSFMFKHFRIAYINDNQWMANELRKPRLNVGNGSIYTGLVFNFN